MVWVAYKRRSWIDNLNIKRNKAVLIGSISIVVSIVLASIVGITEDTAEITNTSPPNEASETQPVETPVPEMTANPVSQLESSIRNIASVNREGTRFDFTYTGSLGVEGNITVWMPLAEGFSRESTRSFAKRRVRDVLKEIDESGVSYNLVRIAGTLPLSNQYGRTKEKKVMMVDYNKSTVDRIQWESFLFENMFEIADEMQFHPAFQEES